MGRACGVDIKYELIDILISKAQSLPGIVSSMLTDARCGRQMEVEVIVGTPVRKARELGIDVPVLQTLYALLVAVNYRMQQQHSA